ncbi:MAG: Rrf2 family transcriptional regulator [Patescibacteria group bacterium]|nr:Rrf2 family transcriptional regulator [Patescibacteria group bacterium]MBU1877062.1 Rrf2 family transcriptional regulator [Patescibacteria group bacterium]
MIKISTKSQYGLRAMVYLAKFPKQISSIKTISKSEDIPFDYLEKIISKLEKSSLIKSKKGVQGGYFLAKNPSKIRIGEIVRVLEGDIVLVKCISGQKGCKCTRERECLTKSFWKKIQDSLNSALDSLTLEDLIK